MSLLNRLQYIRLANPYTDGRDTGLVFKFVNAEGEETEVILDGPVAAAAFAEENEATLDYSMNPKRQFYEEP